jgi:hypothetical protein
MTLWVPGLIRVRRLALGCSLTVSLAIAGWVLYDIRIALQTDMHEPVRFVAAPELFAVVLAALLPAICVPQFDGRELMAVSRSRRLHTLVSASLLLHPLVILVTWYLSVRFHAPTQALPAVHHFAGNLLLAASVGLVLTLALGTRLGPPVTLLAYLGFLLLQQSWPSSVLATHFSTATRWRTDWWLIAAILGAAVAIAHLAASNPWRTVGRK